VSEEQEGRKYVVVMNDNRATERFFEDVVRARVDQEDGTLYLTSSAVGAFSGIAKGQWAMFGPVIEDDEPRQEAYGLLDEALGAWPDKPGQVFGPEAARAARSLVARARDKLAAARA
jgi:hypothetical protein